MLIGGPTIKQLECIVISRIISPGLDAFLEASRRRNYQKATSLIGYVCTANYTGIPKGTVTLLTVSSTSSSILPRERGIGVH
jgi:hypothetical protein